MPHEHHWEPTSTKRRHRHDAEPRRRLDDHPSHRPEQYYQPQQSSAEDGWTGWQPCGEGWYSKPRQDPVTGRWVYKVVTPTYPNGFLVNTTEPTAIYNPNAPSIPHAQQTYDPVKPSWPQQPYSPIEQQQQQQPPWSPSLTAYCEEPQPQPQPQPYPQAASQAPASPVAADQYPVLGQVPPEEQQEEGYLATDNISNTLHDAGSAATTRPKRRKARGLVGDDATTEILLLRDPRESGRVKVTINDTGRRITINTRGGGGGGDDGGTRRTTGRPPGRSREGGYRSRHDGYECGGLGEHGARCNEADGHMFR